MNTAVRELHVSVTFPPDGPARDFMMMGTDWVPILNPFPEEPKSLEERYFAVLTTLRRRASSERERLGRPLKVILDSNDANFLIWAANFFQHTEDLAFSVDLDATAFDLVA
ncbi:hypothetical protein [Tranquillimonas alkanivorans]|uniref:Uncharacterized protein n=1 Tax=Tranquillimonas alkanivorans TaxID=441119 RepID=A0A1I5TT79_9RHOB|nr:hypothetical protein [Tranquillimonas alkanivorans]SFP86233.1 hypothetical protein SAMN04488047_11514 [Tranquillimonas alkanivorans]